MTSHQAQTPPAARAYFASVGVQATHTDHPLITQYFLPDRGWVSETGRQRVSSAKLRKLRAAGATDVQLSAGGHSPDFSIRELLRVDRRPLLGGSLIGSRTWGER